MKLLPCVLWMDYLLSIPVYLQPVTLAFGKFLIYLVEIHPLVITVEYHFWFFTYAVIYLYSQFSLNLFTCDLSFLHTTSIWYSNDSILLLKLIKLRFYSVYHTCNFLDWYFRVSLEFFLNQSQQLPIPLSPDIQLLYFLHTLHIPECLPCDSSIILLVAIR